MRLLSNREIPLIQRMLKIVQVREVIVPRIVAALQRRRWRFLLRDTDGSEIWIDPNRSRELELRPTSESCAKITVLRYHRADLTETRDPSSPKVV